MSNNMRPIMSDHEGNQSRSAIRLYVLLVVATATSVGLALTVGAEKLMAIAAMITSIGALAASLRAGRR